MVLLSVPLMQSEFWLPLQWSSLLAAQVMSEEAGLGRGEGMWMEFACGQRLSLAATLQRADVSERKKRKNRQQFIKAIAA